MLFRSAVAPPSTADRCSQQRASCDVALSALMPDVRITVTTAGSDASVRGQNEQTELDELYMV